MLYIEDDATSVDNCKQLYAVDPEASHADGTSLYGELLPWFIITMNTVSLSVGTRKVFVFIFLPVKCKSKLIPFHSSWCVNNEIKC